MRTVSEAFSSAAINQVVRPRWLFEVETAIGNLNLWNGGNDITWNSKTWSASSFYLGPKNYQEQDKPDPPELEVVFSGEPTAMISLLLNDIKQFRPASVWIALVDASGNVIADPHQYFHGRLSNCRLTDSVDQAQISLTFQSHLVAMNEVREWRYTSATQKIFDASDQGFDYMEQLASDFTGYWGQRQ